MAVVVQWAERDKIKDSRSIISVDVGTLIVYQSENVVTKTEWVFDDLTDDCRLDNDDMCKQIQQYINKPIKCLTLNLLRQGSDFRNRVLLEICKIPVGEVISYSELAGKTNSGARAVAGACRNNPFPGIIPCHRVVSVNGLGGYAGETSGNFFEIKRKLLLLESKLK